MIDLAISLTIGAVVLLTALIIVSRSIAGTNLDAVLEQLQLSNNEPPLPSGAWPEVPRATQLEHRRREVEVANYKLFTGEYSYP